MHVTFPCPSHPLDLIVFNDILYNYNCNTTYGNKTRMSFCCLSVLSICTETMIKASTEFHVSDIVPENVEC
jgi:hypothetical protein